MPQFAFNSYALAIVQANIYPEILKDEGMTLAKMHEALESLENQWEESEPSYNLMNSDFTESVEIQAEANEISQNTIVGFHISHEWSISENFDKPETE
jgi:hypothetical protein